MGRSELTVLVYKHLGLKYFVQALLVNKAEVRNNGVMICKTIKKHNQKKIYNKKGNGTNQEKFQVSTQKEENRYRMCQSEERVTLKE